MLLEQRNFLLHIPQCTRTGVCLEHESRSKIANLWDVDIINFIEIAKLLLKVTVPSYSPLAVWKAHIPHILTNI